MSFLDFRAEWEPKDREGAEARSQHCVRHPCEESGIAEIQDTIYIATASFAGPAAFEFPYTRCASSLSYCRLESAPGAMIDVH